MNKYEKPLIDTNIRKMDMDIKKEDDSCKCPMCTKTNMEEGIRYTCKKTPDAIFGVMSYDSILVI